MEGYVLKWTNFIRGYKTRYLILQENLLYCLKHKNDNKTKAIDLRTSKVIDDKKKNFIIETDKKKLHFKTNTENEKKEWIIKLQENSLKSRLSIISEKDKMNVQESLTELRKSIRITPGKTNTIVEVDNEDFTLKKTDSCQVENFVNQEHRLSQIDDYLQNMNININPSKNKCFSTAYNDYYKEINKNKFMLHMTKFDNLINCHQNIQNLIFELNTVLENFNLLLMSSKFKAKDGYVKIYENLFNIKQEIKEQFDVSVKNLVEYKEETDKYMNGRENERNPVPVEILETDEKFFEAKEEQENERVKEIFEAENESTEIKENKNLNDKENDFECHFEKAKINFDYQNLNIYGDNISVDENDDSSFEDCISRLNDVDNLVDVEFKNSLEQSLMKESKENGIKFKRSLSLQLDDFIDINYNYEQRGLKNYPKIKCSNSMLSDMIKSLTKDKISLPIHYNEPISMLQKQCEKFQYSLLLTNAANIKEDNNPIYLRMCYIAAFLASEMSLNINRILKPFNPILGETFEYFDNSLKYRYLSEQVSHHPPISAFVCESEDYVVYGDTRCKNKFKLLKGAMEITFQNKTNVLFKNTGEHYVYNRPNVYLKGLIMGSPHFDYSGLVTIEEINNKQNEKIKTVLDFFEEGRKSKPIGYFEGKVFNESNDVIYLIKGNWNCSMSIMDKNGKNEVEIWKVKDEAFITNTDLINNYLMSNYACNLNNLPDENESGLLNVIPPTDSRLRPDQRALEVGNLADAESEKNRIENKQRIRHKKFEEEKIKYTPNYFAEVYESKTEDYVYIYKGGYWEDRKSKNFKHLFKVFE